MYNQPLYPNLDQPAAVTPYGYTATPNAGSHIYSPEIVQPLLPNPQIPEENKTLKSVSLVLSVIFFLIEASVLFYIVSQAYLFEYCYWSFGVNKYKKEADQALIYGNGKGEIHSFPAVLDCYTTQAFPECSEICDLARDLRSAQDIMTSFLLVVEGNSFILPFLYIYSSLSSKKMVMTKKLVGIHSMNALVMFIAVWIYYIISTNVLGLSEPKEDLFSHEIGYDEPSEVEWETGGKGLLGLFAFMVTYRIVLVVLAK